MELTAVLANIRLPPNGRIADASSRGAHTVTERRGGEEEGLQKVPIRSL